MPVPVPVPVWRSLQSSIDTPSRNGPAHCRAGRAVQRKRPAGLDGVAAGRAGASLEVDDRRGLDDGLVAGLLTLTLSCSTVCQPGLSMVLSPPAFRPKLAYSQFQGREAGSSSRALAATAGLGEADQSPDLPPCFSSSRMPPITMPRSAALHMS